MAFEGFYPAVLATFKFIHDRFGEETLKKYWRELAEEYYVDVIEKFKKDGLVGVEEFLRGYFSKEPKCEFEVHRVEDRVELVIKQCPAFYWLKEFKREIPDWYCKHCDVINDAICSRSGMKFIREGGNGSCRQIFVKEG